MLIPFPRFNNRPRGERPLEAVWSGGRVFAQICKASTTCISALFTPLALCSRFGGRYKLASQLLLFARAGATSAQTLSQSSLPALSHFAARALQKLPVEFKNTWRRLAPAEHRRPSSTRDPGPRPRTTRCAPPWRVTASGRGPTSVTHYLIVLLRCQD